MGCDKRLLFAFAAARIILRIAQWTNFVKSKQQSRPANIHTACVLFFLRHHDNHRYPWLGDYSGGVTQNCSAEGKDRRKCLGGAASILRHFITNIAFVANSRPLYWSVKKYKTRRGRRTKWKDNGWMDGWSLPKYEYNAWWGQSINWFHYIA